MAMLDMGPMIIAKIVRLRYPAANCEILGRPEQEL